MTAGWRVGVVGATGLVGREMVRVLEERKFPVASLRLWAGERSAGEDLDFAGRPHTVGRATRAAMAGHDVVLMAAGEEAARELAPAAVAGGAQVVDNSAAFRSAAAVPLVVPEVNGHLLAAGGGPAIVANPNCVVIQLMLAVAPLHALRPLRRLLVSTYQSVSGRGQAGMEELGRQVTDLWRQAEPEPRVFNARMAFNLIAAIGAVDRDGHSDEEAKIARESRRILGAPDLQVGATCVRVPVFSGHAAAVVMDFAGPVAVDAARARLAEAAGVVLAGPEAAVPPTPAEATGGDAALVGRLRALAPDSLALWCVADNIRKGAAVNAVQIAEGLVASREGHRRAV